MRHGVLFLALLLANTVSAATQFQYVIESEGDRPTPRRAGTIRVDGVSYRVDHEDKLMATASFSTDGGKTVTALNEKLSTYYRPKDSWEKPSSSFFVGAIPGAKVKVKDVSVTEEPADERIAGFATKKYVLKLAHDVMLGQNVRVFYRSTVLLWTTEEIDLAVLPLDLRELHTGFGEVDRKVREALAGVTGFPLKRRMSVTRQYEGGVVMADTATTTFDDFKTVDLPAAALVVPSGYRYEEPVILTPGPFLTMRHCVLFLALLLANAVSAATQFKVVTESTGDPLNPKSAGTIRVKGTSYRIDGDPEGLLSSASFSTDGGKTVTVLNQKLTTYFRSTPDPKSPSSGLYDVPFVGMDKKSKVSVKDVVLTEEPTDERIAGYETKKYVLTFAHDVQYTIEGEKLRVLFRSTVLLWTTEAIELSVVPMDLREIRTGHDAVDPAVKEALSGVKGFPLKRQMSVTRRYEGGQVMVDAMTTTFDDFKTVDLPPEALVVPAGYRYEEPVMLFPGAPPRD